MGLLVDGKWHDKWYDTAKSEGRFERSVAQLRNWVTPDGSAGPTGRAGFKAEPGRFHLYVSYACPWAHRTLIYRALKGLEDMIPVSAVHWYMAENGWTFDADEDGLVGYNLFAKDFMYQVYLQSEPDYSGRVTVPVLWDTQTGRIVTTHFQNRNLSIEELFQPRLHFRLQNIQIFLKLVVCVL